MNTPALEHIDLGKLSNELTKHENEWIAISLDNYIVASGSTYREVVEQVEDPASVVLFKVPPGDASLAPEAR